MLISLSNGGQTEVDDELFESTLSLEVWAGETYEFRICDMKWRHKDHERLPYVQSVTSRSGRQCCIRLHPKSIISFENNKTNSQLHPTEKPIGLYEYLLQSYPADLTVDPWAGSGTTLVAARNCRRRCVGIEINEAYCEIAANRLSQGVLF